MSKNEIINRQDPEVAAAIAAEEQRQRSNILLIASENYTSAAVMAATGCVMTNKYAEGYPGKRYYAGCVNVDTAEELAIERAKQLFGVDYVNVQPHSGSQANLAAFLTVLKPGERVMGLALDHGGHLSHGSKVNISGRHYEVQHYLLDRETEQLDYDAIEKSALEFEPKMIITGYSAYPRHIDFERFRKIADKVGATLLADISHIAGLIAGKQFPSPVGYADIITTTTHKTLRGPRGAIAMMREDLFKKYNTAVFPRLQGGPFMHAIAAKAVAFKEALQPEFQQYAKQIIENARAIAQVLSDGGLKVLCGGTDSHIVLIDLQPANLTGLQVEEKLEEVGIVVNKNVIPYDPQPARVASGIRIGTAAITSRGFDADDSVQVANLILETFRKIDDPSALAEVKRKVNQFASSFPLFGVD